MNEQPLFNFLNVAFVNRDARSITVRLDETIGEEPGIQFGNNGTPTASIWASKVDPENSGGFVTVFNKRLDLVTLSGFSDKRIELTGLLGEPLDRNGRRVPGSVERKALVILTRDVR